MRGRSSSVDLDAVERVLGAHTANTVRIPYDPHIGEGGEIDLNRLAPCTRDAVLELAAVVADDFARPGRVAGGARRRTAALLPADPDGEHRDRS